MSQFRVRFFDSTTSPKRKELHAEVVTSDIGTTEVLALLLLPRLRDTLGATGYRIEDLEGRTVIVGPGANENSGEAGQRKA
jgi:hypothetical protein